MRGGSLQPTPTASGTDKNDENGNRRDEKGSKERITHRGATTYFGIAEMGRPSKFASEEAKNSQIG